MRVCWKVCIHEGVLEGVCIHEGVLEGVHT